MLEVSKSEGTDNCIRLEQFRNALLPILVTDEGIDT